MGARICAADTVLPRGGGATGESPIFVQAGTRVDMNFGVMQRDPDFWGSDAEEFRPERWQTVRPKWEYIPFLVSSLPFQSLQFPAFRRALGHFPWARSPLWLTFRSSNLSSYPLDVRKGNH